MEIIFPFSTPEALVVAHASIHQDGFVGRHRAWGRLASPRERGSLRTAIVRASLTPVRKKFSSIKKQPEVFNWIFGSQGMGTWPSWADKSRIWRHCGSGRVPGRPGGARDASSGGFGGRENRVEDSSGGRRAGRRHATRGGCQASAETSNHCFRRGKHCLVRPSPSRRPTRATLGLRRKTGSGSFSPSSSPRLGGSSSGTTSGRPRARSCR